MTTEAETRTCITCWAQVRTEVMHLHEEWHANISSVAIENTRRIRALEERLSRDIP